MDECVGIDVLIGRGTTVGDEFQDMGDDGTHKLIDSLKIMTKVGVRSCTLDYFVNDSARPPKLKYPNLLHFVYFKNFVSSKTFETILHGVTNLHTLKIDCFVLHHLEFNDMSVTLPCQVLEICTGGCVVTAIYVLTQSSFEIMSLNLTHLLRNSFPGLKIVKMCVPTVQELLSTVTEEVMNFLYSHAESLTRLDIGMFTYSDDEDENYNLALTHPNPLIPTRRQFKNLREIRLGDWDYEWSLLHSDSSLKDSWMTWADDVENLEEITIIFNCSEVLALLKYLFHKNEATLTSINIRNDELTSFDCVILQNCNKLKKLKIHGGYDDHFILASNLISAENNASASAELHNAEYLPKSLTDLCIEWIPITSEACKIICLDLPNLEKLELIEIGKLRMFGYGVPVDAASEMLQRKKIKQIGVQTGIGAGTQEENIKKLLEKAYHQYNKFPKYLNCILGDNGEYSSE